MASDCPIRCDGATRVSHAGRIELHGNQRCQFLVNINTGEYRCVHGDKEDIDAGGPFTPAMLNEQLVLVGVGGETTGALLLADSLLALHMCQANLVLWPKRPPRQNKNKMMFEL